MSEQENIYVDFLKEMLPPLARFCVKNSISLQDIVEVVKSSCVQEAKLELKKQGKKTTVAALSAMTGVHRKDVTRIHKLKKPKKQSPSTLVKVIGLWQTDTRFTTNKGKAKTLTFGQADSEFTALVESVSLDVHARTILDELVRIEAVKITSRGVKLVQTLFMPKGEKKRSYEMLAREVRDLMYAVEENISSEGKNPHFHIRTEFDNVDLDELLNIKRWILEQGDSFHVRLMKHISQYDKDVNTTLKTKECGGRVAVVGFGFTQRPEVSE